MSTPPYVASSPAHIDPRIRARRIEVQRDVGRRRLQRLVDLGVVLAVVAGFVLASRTPLLDVDAVRVSGNQHTPTAAVLRASGIGAGDQLIDVDLHAAGVLVAALPWVDTVRLHRGLDGQVALRVEERTAVAVVGEGASAVLVDADGRVLARRVDEPGLAAGLVVVRLSVEPPEPGDYLPDGATDVLGLAKRLVIVAPGIVLEAASGVVTGQLPSGAVVHFGGATLIEAKVRDLETVLEQVDLTCAATIDVRAPGSPVLTRQEGCS